MRPLSFTTLGFFLASVLLRRKPACRCDLPAALCVHVPSPRSLKRCLAPLFDFVLMVGPLPTFFFPFGIGYDLPCRLLGFVMAIPRLPVGSHCRRRSTERGRGSCQLAGAQGVRGTTAVRRIRLTRDRCTQSVVARGAAVASGRNSAVRSALPTRSMGGGARRFSLSPPPRGTATSLLGATSAVYGGGGREEEVRDVIRSAMWQRASFAVTLVVT